MINEQNLEYYVKLQWKIDLVKINSLYNYAMLGPPKLPLHLQFVIVLGYNFLQFFEELQAIVYAFKYALYEWIHKKIACMIRLSILK